MTEIFLNRFVEPEVEGMVEISNVDLAWYGLAARFVGNLSVSRTFAPSLDDLTNFLGISSELLTAAGSGSSAAGLASTLRSLACIEGPEPPRELVVALSSSLISTASGS